MAVRFVARESPDSSDRKASSIREVCPLARTNSSESPTFDGLLARRYDLNAMAQDPRKIESAFEQACERYQAIGVDPRSAIEQLARIPVSLQCWQGDDVGGFEGSGSELGGGLAVTGNYPGKARNADELRSDVQMALSLLPGKHRLNLHASYGEFGGKRVDRNTVEPRHFQGWIDWAKQNKLGLDFNPTFFAHPKAA